MALAKKPFVVLDAEILSSSVWSEAAHVRLVWITLLILCDTEGYVGAAIPGIARAAGVSLDEAKDAMNILQQPDPYSRTKASDGRRVEVVERGFRVLNFLEHLDRLSAERTKARERVRRHRERKKKRNSNVTTKDGNVTVRSGNREKGPESRDVEINGQTEGVILPPVSPERQTDLDEIKACEATCREYMTLTGKAMDEVLWQFSEVGGKRLVRLDTPNLKWLRVTHDRIRAALIEARQEKRKPAGEDPLAKIRRIEAAREERLRGETA